MNWDSIKFGDLYSEDSRNGLTKPSKVRGSGYKMINMGELFANDRIYDIPMELVPLKENEKKNAKVEKGDFAICTAIVSFGRCRKMQHRNGCFAFDCF